MAEISFSLIDSATLQKCRHLSAKEADAVIDVTGPFTDPSSLQRFRDAVSESFKDHRKNLSTLMLKHDELVGKAENPQERDKLIKQFTQQQQDAAKRIEGVLQQKMDAIQEKTKTGAMAEFITRSQFKVAVVWSAYKITSTAMKFFQSSYKSQPPKNGSLDVLVKQYTA